MSILLYHGSPKIVRTPKFGVGSSKNDYGSGFYVTLDAQMAKEWAIMHGSKGYLLTYSLETKGLRILDLNQPEYSILNWIAMLVANRNFMTSQYGKEAKQLLIEQFYPAVKDIDLIIGYRADDNYSRIARDFVSSLSSIKQLQEGLIAGKLGQQYFVRSRTAFQRLTFVNAEEVYPRGVDNLYLKWNRKETAAKNKYISILQQSGLLQDSPKINMILDGSSDIKDLFNKAPQYNDFYKIPEDATLVTAKYKAMDSEVKTPYALVRHDPRNLGNIPMKRRTKTLVNFALNLCISNDHLLISPETLSPFIPHNLAYLLNEPRFRGHWATYQTPVGLKGEWMCD